MSHRTFAAVMYGICFVGVVVTAWLDDAVAAEPPSPGEMLVKRLDCLINMPGPRPGIASKAFLPFLGETRKWLSEAPAQEALFRDLPKLSTRQLVALWDVLWIAPDAQSAAASPQDMDAIAVGFARKFNDAALAALVDEKEPDRRRLLINMIKPQAHTLTEKQATEFLKAGGWKEN